MEKFKKIGGKIGDKIDLKILALKVFDDPRPKYVAHVTIIDRILDVLLLWIFPESVRPNWITLFRFISIPFIIYLIFSGHNTFGLVLFVISAFSDAVDGAIARTRNKITDWGIVFDPLADKLLIVSVGGILIYKFLNPYLAGVIAFFEIVLIASAYYRFKGEIVPAKIVGKLKMILQSVGVGFIFLFLATGNPIDLVFANWILYLAVFFAFLSTIVYRSI